MSTSSIALEEIMAKKLGSVDPSSFPNEEFDLYSIPAFDQREPEVLKGSQIGSAKQIVQPGDVLLSRIVPHIRRAWVVGNQRGRRIVASGEWIVFRSQSVEPRYLRHVLISEPFYGEFMRTVSGVGGSLLRARAAYVAKIHIPLPPVPEQQRLAEILDKAEGLRANRRTALLKLDVLTQSIFLDMFGDPAAMQPAFPLLALDAVIAQPLQNGAYFPKEAYATEGGVEMVHMSDAFYGMVARGALKRVKCDETQVAKYSILDSDILIARRSLNYEGAAKPCLIPKSEEPLIFESSFIRLTPRRDTVTVPYLYHYLSNDRVRRKFVLPLVTQSTISGINQSNLARVPVIVPPLALQDAFARRLRVVDRLRAAQEASLPIHDALFTVLQYRAFTGELA
jgi:type I restriction enzyme S subunit